MEEGRIEHTNPGTSPAEETAYVGIDLRTNWGRSQIQSQRKQKQIGG
jgi:hypothetical protein